MSRVESILTTFVCDLPGCGSEVVLGGTEPEGVAEERGWAIQVPIMSESSHFDLCPPHHKEIERWLKND